MSDETPGQRFEGTDRQCRGRLLAVLREATAPVGRSRVRAAWGPGDQVDRCLDALVTDGLAVAANGDRFALPW